MAFKFITIFTLLAAANAGYISSAPLFKYVNPDVNAVAATQQNVIRSFDGTISSDSKAVHTPYSSVRKVDTRINNNVYSPVVAKTVAYTAPVVTHNVATPTIYSHANMADYPSPSVTQNIASPVIYSYAAPAVTKTAVTPTIYGLAKTVAYPTPSVRKTIAIPATYTHAAPTVTKTVYSQSSPATYSQGAANKAVVYSTPAVTTTTYNHGPAATTYSHNAPGLSGYGTSQTIQYSPADMVSHMSFDGFGTHWGY